MSEYEAAIEEFLTAAEDCYSEYENGYVDADATLRRLEKHVEELQATVE